MSSPLDMHLTGRLVARLEPLEQFVLWALRQRIDDVAPASPILALGFRTMFGLGRVEVALERFERLIAPLGLGGSAPLLPLRCAFLGQGEARLVERLLATTRDRGCRDCMGCPLATAIVGFADLLQEAWADHQENPSDPDRALH